MFVENTVRYADRALDTHEGAESPLLGLMATFVGTMTSFGSDTSRFSHRLSKKPRKTGVEMSDMSRMDSNGETEEIDPAKGITSKQLYHLAYRMAAKTYAKKPSQNLTKPRNQPGLAALRNKVAAKKAKGGRGYQITSATAHYVCDLAITGAKSEHNDLRGDLY